MTNAQYPLPILYSLRHCPYAMRARIAIFKSKQAILLRDIKLANKPEEMLALSQNKTVPMLVVSESEVIEESIDIMIKMLIDHDPHNLLQPPQSTLSEMLIIIHRYDLQFKEALNAYRCSKRYQENNVVELRAACEVFIEELEQRLTSHRFLMSDCESLLDIALMPFIRQFSKVERQWYQKSPYPKLRAWLNSYLQSPMFTKVMAKHDLWVECHRDIIWGDI
ncbi:glutathione S-transferase [Psychromonas sp. psych-6C06]|uniref:glutathione S-transferase n=1 Tax=Psychromonas sp. psych-6C06 TaxID=2058089 RepID=UPI000C347FBB|nr:glutathione S-transferase [Psychromonas sp. psych-6C06]PKF62719.1 glutathione S-transferase [Psychromonas sp. psych-6C06]